MNPLYQEIPEAAIPEIGSKPRLMLDLFMTGGVISEQALCDKFGRNYRSILQRLRGEKYHYWYLIPVKENNVIEARYLDPRHLLSNRNQDALARKVRRKELKQESLNEAINGASRVQKAYEEFEEARTKLAELEKENAQQKPSV